VFFEMLTGQSPYKDESPLGMMLEVVQAEIPDVRMVTSGIDPRLAEILKRMVAKDPADRYPDCHQLIADLVATGVNAATPVTPLRAVPNPVVGTVVNAPTPPEMRRLQTPPPAPGYSTVASGERALPLASAPMPAPAAAADGRPALVQSRKASVLPWAAAVVALVAAGGGAAWYIGGRDTGATAVESTAAAIASLDPAAAAPSAAPAPALPEPADAGTVVDGASLPTTTDSEPVASAAVATAAGGAPIAAPGQLVAEAVQPAADSAVTSAPAPRASAPETAETPQSAEIGARMADLREQRRERREARAEAGGGKPQYAKATAAPSPQAPVYAGPARVLVLGFGDPAVAASAEMAIEERLSEAGLEIVDEDFVGGLSGIEDGSPDMARLVANAGRHAEFVVVVRVVPLGEQLLTFYGEAMTQYTARLDVGAFDVRNKRKLGSGWNTQVSFTHLNADPNTREAIAPYLGRIAQGLGARGRG
jgi:serine/threonine-protein kinase